MSLRCVLACLGCLSAPLVACDKDDAPPGGGGLSIEIAPLHLPGIARACYDLRVKNQAGTTVWSRGVPGQTASNKAPTDTRAVCSDAFGNAVGGDIAYVGSCDASLVDDDGDLALDDPNTNTVTVWVDGLYDATGADIGDWRDPCPGGCNLQVDCRENADTPVDLNLVVMREAGQGFFDVAVSFSDVFCSAKLDCLPELLHDASGTRATTAVVGFACTAGPTDQHTTLYLDDIVIACAGEPNATPPIAAHTYTVTPSGAVGQHGPNGAGIFEQATYRGVEQLTGVGEKCFWNNAIGLDLAHLEPGCTLRLRGSASPTAFDADPFFHTPARTIYPVIDWTVPLTSDTGALICGSHPLDGGNGVATGYTSGEQFINSYPCGGTPITSHLTCAGEVASIGAVTVGQSGAGISVTANGRTVQYPALGANLEIQNCCADSCCVEVTP